MYCAPRGLFSRKPVGLEITAILLGSLEIVEAILPKMAIIRILVSSTTFLDVFEIFEMYVVTKLFSVKSFVEICVSSVLVINNLSAQNQICKN